MIYILEDDASIRKLVVYTLNSQGMEAEGFERPSAFWSAMEEKKPDLVLLDIMLPEEDGLQVLKRLRLDPSTQKLPVLMLTARSTEYDKVLGLDSGANDYSTKPFASQELLARIRAMTREQTVQATSRLQVGNITLDRATFELSSPTGRLRLANKEFQMLELLMCNPRNLISTERFLEKIWGYDNEAEINVVWVYISYLRKKLAALHGNIQIKARRNAGYYLEEAI